MRVYPFLISRASSELIQQMRFFCWDYDGPIQNFLQFSVPRCLCGDAVVRHQGQAETGALRENQLTGFIRGLMLREKP